MTSMTAIYARVSSEHQKEERTIKSQTSSLISYARDNNYTVPEDWIFEDEGYTGSNLHRPGLERIRDLAAERQIETVLVYSPDRLSRKYAYQVLLTEELSKHGVEIVFIKSLKGDSPEERLMLQFQGMIAEYERAQIMERTRRGKRHKAKSGSVNVMSGAPYGYNYTKKTEHSDAHYVINEVEAENVQEVYRLYVEEWKSIGDITRILTQNKVITKKGKSYWDRSTIWAMLRNPAYKGMAAFGKTRKSDRKKITKPLRERGGHSPRSSCNSETPKEEWISVPVPPLITIDIYDLAQQRLEQNKEKSKRNTKVPSLLQGTLVCQKCGYSYYRTSTTTSKKRIYYYRCLGSDNYRYPDGKKCDSRPIRQDYIDELIWKETIALVKDKALIESEIKRRAESLKQSSGQEKKRAALESELKKVNSSIDRLLSAYEAELITIEELRTRVAGLRERQIILKKELDVQNIKDNEKNPFLQSEVSIGGFLQALEDRITSIDILDQQKIIKLLIKDILISESTITINHSIPLLKKKLNKSNKSESCLLRGWSH
jgi:site-specific DNA recombinase